MNSSISRVSKKTFLDSSHTLKTENEYGMCMYVSCPIQRADFAGHSSPPASCNSTAAWVETSPKTTRTTFGFFLDNWLYDFECKDWQDPDQGRNL